MEKEIKFEERRTSIVSGIKKFFSRVSIVSHSFSSLHTGHFTPLKESEEVEEEEEEEGEQEGDAGEEGEEEREEEEEGEGEGEQEEEEGF